MHKISFTLETPRTVLRHSLSRSIVGFADTYGIGCTANIGRHKSEITLEGDFAKVCAYEAAVKCWFETYRNGEE